MPNLDRLCSSWLLLCVMIGFLVSISHTYAQFVPDDRLILQAVH